MKGLNEARKQYLEELEELLQNCTDKKELAARLSDYHDHDIAGVMERLTPRDRLRMYRTLGVERTAEIFSYLEDASPYMEELSPEKAAQLVSHMDSDDAVDLLEDMDDSFREEIVKRMDQEASKDVRLLLSYEEDEVGSRMTTNYICISSRLTIREAMRELISQAGENDNISKLYVVDEKGQYCGVIDLKDLIVAREHDPLEDIISHSYPYLLDHEKISSCIDRIREYAEDSFPVLTEEGRIAGIITSSDIVELVDEAMGEDYAKLGGLSAEEDLNETALQSMKKRLPWLVALLFLGMVVSTVTGMFEMVAAMLPVLVCFQSLVLDMAGNVGTQSLAVTIRVLMDENLKAKQKAMLVGKEVRIGLSNGLVLGSMTAAFLGVYIHLFKGYGWLHGFLIAGCVGVALLAAMVISSVVGTAVPMFFHRVHVDPAVASGPMITTINDLVAVVTYYGLAMMILIRLCNIVS